MGSKHGLRSHRGWASREQGDLGKAGQRSEPPFPRVLVGTTLPSHNSC